jgi:hypothetical protein
MTRSKKVAVDFDDEEAVLAEMSRELDVELDELRIEESHLGDFGAGTVYEITIRGGHKDWYVVADEDQERELALAIVKQDLEEEPGNFNKDFIESHINVDRLKRDLHSDVLDMNIETLKDRSADEFWREWEGFGLDLPDDVYEEGEDPDDPDDHGDARDPDDSELEELAEKQTEDTLRDPMGYLNDTFGDEAAAKAIEIAGIDIGAAAEDAVDTDGPSHFLSSYDGNSYVTKGGLVYWRHN